MSTERFDIRHAPAPRESFRLLYISKSKFGGDWNSTAHTHSCTELFYCLSGEGQFYLSGQLSPVKPDDMVIVNPQVEHTELSLNASPLEYIVLGVAGIEILFGKADSSYAIFNCRETGNGWSLCCICCLPKPTAVWMAAKPSVRTCWRCC